MSSDSRTAAILVAAGSGSRAGGQIPKQYAALGGQPMICHAYRALAAHPRVDDVLVVIAEGMNLTSRRAWRTFAM
jgi:2-C-methyl-D-erythritol 4-phosphate cytidylyltransferase/2-C-methyl-D-erythritol 2,4-cyclodiphosphate synthase